MDPVLEVRGLTKSYGGRTVLSRVDLTVPRGRLLTLTGRSGTGKSTLFRLFAGLERPTEGSILLEGREISELSDDEMSDVRLRRLGLVFQSFNLLPDLDVRSNVRLPMDIAGVPLADANARASWLLEVVGLERLAHRSSRSISGGEAQRVAVARALANEPALLLADEPTGNLDEENARKVLDLFDEVNARLGTTVMIISHDPLAIKRASHRLSLQDGRLRATADGVVKAE